MCWWTALALSVLWLGGEQVESEAEWVTLAAKRYHDEILE